MLYVVVRDIEDGARQDEVVFLTLEEAQSYYDKAQHICDNDPDEFGEGDPAIVTRCWLYAANAADPSLARAMVADGRAALIASYSEESLDL